MARTPFKMKGFSGFGNPSLKNKKSTDTRSTWQKAKDEVGQIWAGTKALVTATDRGFDAAQRAYLKQEQKDRAKR